MLKPLAYRARHPRHRRRDLALAWPGITILALAIVFAVYAFIAPGLEGVRPFSSARAWPVMGHLLLGLVDLAAGVIAISWPGPAVLVLVLVAGFWGSRPGAGGVFAGFRDDGGAAGTRALFIPGGLVPLLAAEAGQSVPAFWLLLCLSLTDLDKTSRGPRRRPRAGLEVAAMEENFVWMTTRRIKPGTLADFKRLWRPERHPDGMLHAYAFWSDDEQEIIGVSSWVSREACDDWRASWEETRRRAAMEPYVLSEQEGFYRGRELIVPPEP